MTHSPAVEFVHLGMKFGNFTALEDVNLLLPPYRFHVILGENGAGKSTLMKCLVGYQQPTSGQVVVDGSETAFRSPKDAHKAGLGMVYQHFTLADNMTVAENFLLAREDLPFLVNRRTQDQELYQWMTTQPFQLPLDAPAGSLAAGEKQKLEILMQLYRRRRILILDEPSSVLTPREADEILGLLKSRVQDRELTVILITHKFREFSGYGDSVAVLRRGRLVGSGEAKDYTPRDLGVLMVGEETAPSVRIFPPGKREPGPVALEVKNLNLLGDRGTPVLKDFSLKVREGEILGLAGVSGNGQKELVETFMGLHPREEGALALHGTPFRSRRQYLRHHGLALLPELPVRNAGIGSLSVWENLSLHSPGYKPKELKEEAQDLQGKFGIRAAHLGVPLNTLSGGNVQRTVLARELRPGTRILVVANPCFGLDFQAAADIRSLLLESRDLGAAVLLISEDLDEILELSDRVAVVSDGRITWEGNRGSLDLAKIGQAMAGHGGNSHETS